MKSREICYSIKGIPFLRLASMFMSNKDNLRSGFITGRQEAFCILKLALSQYKTHQPRVIPVVSTLMGFHCTYHTHVNSTQIILTNLYLDRVTCGATQVLYDVVIYFGCTHHHILGGHLPATANGVTASTS